MSPCHLSDEMEPQDCGSKDLPSPLGCFLSLDKRPKLKCALSYNSSDFKENGP